MPQPHHLLLLLLLALTSTASSSYLSIDWSSVDSTLTSSIASGAFPGAVAVVGDTRGYLYAKAFGDYTYGTPPPYLPPSVKSGVPPMTLDTRFDMASCTKVVATTSAVALLYQDGLLDLDMRVADETLLGSGFANHGKDSITVRNCLLHNAGYPPDPVPNYWDPAFACPQTGRAQPAEDFSCRQKCYESLLEQELARPPDHAYVYSDLSFLTLMWVAGTVAKTHAAHYGLSEADLVPGCVQGNASDAACWFEAFTRTQVFDKLYMKSSSFLVDRDDWGLCAPAENDTVYEKKVIQGQVSDGNAYALGGIAGHAGLFSTAPDVFTLAHHLLSALTVPGSETFLNTTTMRLFSRQYNATQSSRALGWNTNSDVDPDMGWNHTCGSLSPSTFLHIGYTGTQVCIDPDRGIITILLTNRVYPTDKNTKIRRARQLYNDAVVAALDAATLVTEREHQARLRKAYTEFVADGPPAPAPAPETRVIPFSYPLFKQCNSSWGSTVMERETICQVGCLMSSISMSLRGKHVRINGNFSNPWTLNHWLQHNGGYTSGDELIESVVPKINPMRVKWVGSFATAHFTAAELHSMLNGKNTVVIANVMHGHHFVLVTGYSTEPSLADRWYVNDPGFNKDYYTTSDVVGWRIFSIV